jgi:hypothetical protein
MPWQADLTAEEIRAELNPTKKITAQTQPNSIQKPVRQDLVQQPREENQGA